jgi:ribosomal protein S18 acetylase RimI-like enzyme
VSRSEPTVADLLHFHYACLQGTYFNEHITLGAGALLFSDRITDPYYNFWAPEEAGRHDEPPAEVREAFEDRGRAPALYGTPLNGGVEDLGSLEVWAKDAWLVAEVDDLETNVSISEGTLELELMSGGRREEYVETFARAYGGGGPDDPYGDLDAAYSDSLWASFDVRLAGFSTCYLLALLDGTPAGVAAMYTSGDLAGVYGVGTVPEMRHRGVGRAMMARLAGIAGEDGARFVVLQTEAGSVVQGWYEDMGYELRFVAPYLLYEPASAAPGAET